MAWSWTDLATVGSFLTAILALVRPEISRFLTRAMSKVEIHPAGRLEVGFSEYGPTMAVIGTLRAHSRDQFIVNMDIIVTRQRDNMQHKFEWTAFRSNSMGGSSQEIQVATGFMVQQEQPKQFSIVFSDRDTQELVSAFYDKIRSATLEYLKNRNVLLRDLSPRDRKVVHTEFDDYARQLKSDAWGKIGRIFYWEAGTYHMRLNVQTSQPNNLYTLNTHFNITSDEEDTLRLNIMNLIAAASIEPDINWQLANVRYRN